MECVIKDLFGNLVIECACDKSCDIGEYLGYKNCNCRKKITDKLTEECSENINGNEMLYNDTLDIIASDNNKTSNSCIVYKVLFSVFLIINISMAIYVYFFLYLKINQLILTILGA